MLKKSVKMSGLMKKSAYVIYEWLPRKLADMLMLVRKRIYKKRSVGGYNFELGKGVKIAVSSYNLVQVCSRVVFLSF